VRTRDDLVLREEGGGEARRKQRREQRKTRSEDATGPPRERTRQRIENSADDKRREGDNEGRSGWCVLCTFAVLGARSQCTSIFTSPTLVWRVTAILTVL